jgi:hypothetical protein
MATEQRPDLAALSVRRNPYTVPWLANPVKVTTTQAYYFPQKYASSTIQSGRNLSAAPTAEDFATNATSATLAEIIDRQTIDDRILAQYGGLAGAQVAMATRSHLSVQKGLEQLIAEQVLDGGATVPQSVSTNWVNSLKDASFTLGDIVNARIGLVCGQSLYLQLIADSGIVAEMAKQPAFVAASTEPNSVRMVRRQLLAAAIGVDEVIVGGTDVWDAASITNDTCVAVMALPSPGMSCQEEIQALSYIQQVVGGEGNYFGASSHYSDDKKANVVDVWTNALVDVINADLIQLVKLS